MNTLTFNCKQSGLHLNFWGNPNAIDPIANKVWPLEGHWVGQLHCNWKHNCNLNEVKRIYLKRAHLRIVPVYLLNRCPLQSINIFSIYIKKNNKNNYKTCYTFKWVIKFDDTWGLKFKFAEQCLHLLLHFSSLFGNSNLVTLTPIACLKATAGQRQMQGKVNCIWLWPFWTWHLAAFAFDSFPIHNCNCFYPLANWRRDCAIKIQLRRIRPSSLVDSRKRKWWRKMIKGNQVFCILNLHIYELN